MYSEKQTSTEKDEHCLYSLPDLGQHSVLTTLKCNHRINCSDSYPIALKSIFIVSGKHITDNLAENGLNVNSPLLLLHTQ